MINRRNFLNAIPAVALAATLPTTVVAMTNPSVGETTMEVVKKYFSHQVDIHNNLMSWSPSNQLLYTNEDQIKINQKVVDLLPKIFNSQRQIPYLQLNDPLVCTRALRTRSAIRQVDDKNEWFDFIALELAADIQRWENINNRLGNYVRPYIPVIAFRAVDPNTFQPIIAFKTRYGVSKL